MYIDGMEKVEIACAEAERLYIDTVKELSISRITQMPDEP